MASEFGELLRKYRSQKGFSQRELVKRLHYQGYQSEYVRTDISRWENGLRTPEADVVEVLEDILGVPPGNLLDAANYSDAAEVRRGRASRVRETQWREVLELTERLKKEVQTLGRMHTVAEPSIGRMKDPGVYDIWLEDRRGKTAVYKYEKGGAEEVTIHCPVEYEPGFASLRERLSEAGVWQHYEEWQDAARKLVAKIGDRRARGSYGGEGASYPPHTGVPADDLRIQLDRLAVVLEQNINSVLAEAKGTTGE